MDDVRLRHAATDAPATVHERSTPEPLRLRDTRAALREFFDDVALGRASAPSRSLQKCDVEREVALGRVPDSAYDEDSDYDAPRDYAIRRDAQRARRRPDNLVFAAFDTAWALGREWLRASPAAAPAIHYQQLAQRRLARSMRERPVLTLGAAFVLGAVALRLRPWRMVGAASTVAIGAWKLSRSPLVAALATVGPGALLRLLSARRSTGDENRPLRSPQ